MFEHALSGWYVDASAHKVRIRNYARFTMIVMDSGIREMDIFLAEQVVKSIQKRWEEVLSERKV